MKNSILLAILIIGFSACQNASKDTAKTTPQNSVAADSTAIAKTIHDFYKWYTSSPECLKNDFTTEVNKHLKLDATKFDAYLACLKNTGLVSASFLENERAMFKKCEMFWQYETTEGPPTCLDCDRFFCSQDIEEEGWWTKSPVKLKSLGADKYAATMHEGSADGRDHNFEVVKEGGKWLISNVECQLVPTEPWLPEDFIVVTNKGVITVAGEKVKLEKVKAVVQKYLSENVALLPKEIPIKFGDQLLMGMRGAVGDEVNAALEAEKAARDKK